MVVAAAGPPEGKVGWEMGRRVKEPFDFSFIFLFCKKHTTGNGNWLYSETSSWYQFIREVYFCDDGTCMITLPIRQVGFMIVML